MEKTIVIDGKNVRLKATGATPLRYKAQFGKDFFAEILRLNKLINSNTKEINFEQIDFEIVYNIVWTMAKTADPEIPDPITWLDGFDTFPIMDIFYEVQDMLIESIQSKKKTLKEIQKKQKN